MSEEFGMVEMNFKGQTLQLEPASTINDLFEMRSLRKNARYGKM